LCIFVRICAVLLAGAGWFCSDGVVRTACRQCEAGTATVQACTTTTDTVCEACADGMWCDGTSSVACRSCGLGQVTVSACTASSDAQCAQCAASEPLWCDGQQARNCTPSCEHGMRIEQPCSVTHDTVCAACGEGEWCNGEHAFPCSMRCEVMTVIFPLYEMCTYLTWY
jgi:hypothetical protein